MRAWSRLVCSTVAMVALALATGCGGNALPGGGGDAGGDGGDAGGDGGGRYDMAGEGGSRCTRNEDCTAGELCKKPDAACDGVGECAPRPSVCPELYSPTCGCDGVTYGSTCDAQAHGTNVRRAGECDGLPTCEEPPPRGCCYQASECGGVGSRCVGGDCQAGEAGTCVALLGPPYCWEDSDCGAGFCEGAMRCPCGARCVGPDKPGTCKYPR